MNQSVSLKAAIVSLFLAAVSILPANVKKPDGLLPFSRCN
jgi:hypothetical protein